MSVPKNEITQRFTRHQLQRYCIFETARKAASNTIDNNNNTSTSIEEKKDRDFAAKVPSFLKYGSMLVFKSQTRYLEANRVCLASTTDHRQSESLINVLPEHGEDDETERFYTYTTMHPRHQVQFDGLFLMRVPHPNPETAPRWWSSRPNLSEDGPQERLLFTLRYPECLISEVRIKPLRDPYVGHPVYSWKRTKIQAYRLPLRILGEPRTEVGRQNDPTSTTSSTAIAAASSSSSRSSVRSSSLRVQQQHSIVERDIDMTLNDLGQQQQPQPQPQIPLLSGSWVRNPLFPRLGRDDPHPGGDEDEDWELYHSNPETNGIVQISRDRRLPQESQVDSLVRRFFDPPEDSVIQDLVLNGHVPVYESPEMWRPIYHERTSENHLPSNHSSDLLKFALPSGIVANVIVVTLIGKNHEQVRGTGYYAAVERVDCRGIPLYAHQSVELE